jgi:hypothetical protein
MVLTNVGTTYSPNHSLSDTGFIGSLVRDYKCKPFLFSADRKGLTIHALDDCRQDTDFLPKVYGMADQASQWAKTLVGCERLSGFISSMALTGRLMQGRVPS